MRGKTARKDHFEQLEKIQVLVVGGDSGQGPRLCEMLSQLPLLNVTQTPLRDTAESALTGRTIHCCVIYRHRDATAEQITHLIAAMARRAPVCLVDGRGSAAEGARWHAMGSAVLDELELHSDMLIDVVFTGGLRALLAGEVFRERYIEMALDVLWQSNPATVGSWVAKLDNNESYHRRKCSEAGRSPKRILRLYRDYTGLYERCLKSNGGVQVRYERSA